MRAAALATNPVSKIGCVGARAGWPAVPLLQPTQVFASTQDLKNAVFNAVYQVDVTQVAPK
jgi:hypothetical protein